MTSVFEYRTFEDIDLLLKRDWFLDSENIWELLWTADVDTYERLEKNYAAYSPRIQYFLRPPVKLTSRRFAAGVTEPESASSRYTSSASLPQTGFGSS